jgi:hypothetical protein
VDLPSNEAAKLEVAVPDNQTDQMAGTFRSKLGDDTRERFLRVIPAGILCCLALPAVMQAQSDPARSFKMNCVLCHSADGSGDSATGKALRAKDLLSSGGDPHIGSAARVRVVTRQTNLLSGIAAAHRTIAAMSFPRNSEPKTMTGLLLCP